MMNVKVKLYNGIKYDLKNYKVAEDGETATFCNSHVDMFRI